MVTALRSKWAVGKAVRAGLAVEGAYLNANPLLVFANSVENGVPDTTANNVLL